jgi:hypothetical protein
MTDDHDYMLDAETPDISRRNLIVGGAVAGVAALAFSRERPNIAAHGSQSKSGGEVEERTALRHRRVPVQ